jgi:homopolymeric O-antigen transport system permease protein
MPAVYRELLTKRTLVWGLTRRALIARYRGTSLGFLWSFAHPLILFGVYALVFGVFVRIEVAAPGGYAAFVLAGLLPWIWFAQAVSMGTTSILGDAPFVRQVAFSPAVPPLVTCLATGVHFALGLPVLVAILWILGAPPTPWLLALVPVALVQVSLCLGLTLGLGALCVRYRDVAQLTQAGLPILFFLTPVIYPVSAVPPELSWLTWVNPLALLALAYQQLLRGGPPDPGLLAARVGVAAIWALAACALGGWVLGRCRDRIPEEL